MLRNIPNKIDQVIAGTSAQAHNELIFQSLHRSRNRFNSDKVAEVSYASKMHYAKSEKEAHVFGSYSRQRLPCAEVQEQFCNARAPILPT
ncbi:MAG: hypothetical protein Q9197_005356 [Variospora fuerteventurae]